MAGSGTVFKMGHIKNSVLQIGLSFAAR